MLCFVSILFTDGDGDGDDDGDDDDGNDNRRRRLKQKLHEKETQLDQEILFPPVTLVLFCATFFKSHSGQFLFF